jgi:hypothetical protein
MRRRAPPGRRVRVSVSHGRSRPPSLSRPSTPSAGPGSSQSRSESRSRYLTVTRTRTRRPAGGGDGPTDRRTPSARAGSPTAAAAERRPPPAPVTDHGHPAGRHGANTFRRTVADRAAAEGCESTSRANPGGGFRFTRAVKLPHAHY